jgi:ADP-L-glycero-D-manno-heptose 6-epimerase
MVRTTPDGLGRFDHVLHLGACSATTERDADYLMRNNYELTRLLCEWTLERGGRFVYASSAATYGDGAHGMDDRLQDLHRLRPLNMYGYSKHLFDLQAQRSGLLDRVAGLKYFNVYGPNEDHKADMRSVVHKAHRQILETGRVQLFKSHRPDYQDGCQQRDFLYVKDAVKMTLHLAANPQVNGLFNLGSGRAHTWVELARAIFLAMGREPVIEFIDMPEALREKYQYYTCADIGRMRESGYDEPLFTLEEAVRDYVQGYLAHDRRLGDEA